MHAERETDRETRTREKDREQTDKEQCVYPYRRVEISKAANHNGANLFQGCPVRGKGWKEGREECQTTNNLTSDEGLTELCLRQEDGKNNNLLHCHHFCPLKRTLPCYVFSFSFLHKQNDLGLLQYPCLVSLTSVSDLSSLSLWPLIPLSLPSSHPSISHPSSPPSVSHPCLSPPLPSLSLPPLSLPSSLPCFINSMRSLYHLMYFLYFDNFWVMRFKTGENNDVLCRN